MRQPFYFKDVTSREVNVLANFGVVLSKLSQELSYQAFNFYQKQSIRTLDVKQKEFTELCEYLIVMLSEELQTNFSQTHTMKWTKKLNKKCIDIQMPMDCMIFIAPYVKQSIWKFLASQVTNKEITSNDSMLTVQAIDFLVDCVQEETGAALIQSEKEEVYMQTLRGLKAPVIPVTQGIGVLPLIGDVDSYKTQLIMDTTVASKVKELQLFDLIVDLSGVNHLDTYAAQDIFNFSQTMDLIGIEVIIVGVTPDIAQTSVNLNISFRDFKVYPNLSIALQDMLEQA